MKILRSLLDQVEPAFTKGKLKVLYPVYEAVDTFLYTPGEVTKGDVHVHDSLDLKRMMITVVGALGPCIIMALWNTGHQANAAMLAANISAAPGWRGQVMELLGMGYNPYNVLQCIVHGALYFVPIFLVANIAGGTCEAIFSIIRKHEINEGFLVTGMLYPLTLPANIPLWQVAVGIIFGVIIGKEVFGGTGKNFLNPALTARAFLYFAYPAQITGNAVWVAVDGVSQATPLGVGAAEGFNAIMDSVTFLQAFLGNIPGSMGETSVLACLIGAAILIGSKVGSWQTMLSMTLGTLFTATALYAIGSDTNPMFNIPPHWHLVLGSFAFGCVFMATDPVSSAQTTKGKWYYGAIIGFMTVLIRVINPAFPEGVMLAILFGNVFAPVIDYYVLKGNIKRRKLRLA